jgi:hypothetical protein
MKIYRKLMEEKLGRKLTMFEVVHHIDGNHFNNDINNLMVMTTEEHNSIHAGSRPRKKGFKPYNKTSKIIKNKIIRNYKYKFYHGFYLKMAKKFNISDTTARRIIKDYEKVKWRRLQMKISPKNIKVVKAKDRKKHIIEDIEGLTIGKAYTKD